MFIAILNRLRSFLSIFLITHSKHVYGFMATGSHWETECMVYRDLWFLGYNNLLYYKYSKLKIWKTSGETKLENVWAFSSAIQYQVQLAHCFILVDETHQ